MLDVVFIQFEYFNYVFYFVHTQPASISIISVLLSLHATSHNFDYFCFNLFRCNQAQFRLFLFYLVYTQPATISIISVLLCLYATDHNFDYFCFTLFTRNQPQFRLFLFYLVYAQPATISIISFCTCTLSILDNTVVVNKCLLPVICRRIHFDIVSYCIFKVKQVLFLFELLSIRNLIKHQSIIVCIFIVFFRIQHLSVLRNHSFFSSPPRRQWPPTSMDFYSRFYP